MPDKSWRKKIHGKQPRTLPPLKTTPKEENGEDLGDRRRAIGWRKTIQGSRPETPSGISPLTPTINEADDVRSEHSEPQTPRRSSRPKVARYTSLFSSFKDSSKGPDFAEPWSHSLPFQPYIDPLQALQAVHSHMINFSTPIPLEHNSGLFRVFEDYRKTRHEKERLESLLQDTLTNWTRAEAGWADSEFCYRAEIRRLEILIANDRDGMTGSGSVIDRKRGHRATISYDKNQFTHIKISDHDLDNEIQARSQQSKFGCVVATEQCEKANNTVLRRRLVSPSEKMTNLSEYLIKNQEGQPPIRSSNEHKSSRLSRKVQSELDLKSMVRGDDGCQRPGRIMSGNVGDLLLDKRTSLPISEISELELDSFIALRELGGLVARRRGIEVDTFVGGLLALLSTVQKTHPYTQSNEEKSKQTSPPALEKPESFTGDQDGRPSIHRRNLRRFQSQPQLRIDQKRRRHFSFDLGDDQLHELGALDSYTHSPTEDLSSDLEISPSLQRGNMTSKWHTGVSRSSSQPLNAEIQRPSKIPSPVGTLGRTRREDFTPSLQTVFTRPVDERRNSNSSIRTAFREQLRNSLRPISASAGSSNYNLCALESTAAPKHLSKECRNPEEMVALTAAGREDDRTRPTSDSLARSHASSSPSAALLLEATS
ncbi:hypothetical protein J1614_002137 [Plenodomus biglobosus]|nr:hypothetical protein J1614_002137 [Plenodomus biglobosus]